MKDTALVGSLCGNDDCMSRDEKAAQHALMEAKRPGNKLHNITERRAGQGRVCTTGMLPHELGNFAWLTDTLQKVTVCDLRNCYDIESTKGDRALITSDEEKSLSTGIPVPCIQPFYNKYKMDATEIQD
eukprot:g7834.t1